MTAVNQETKCKRLVKDILRSFDKNHVNDNNEITTMPNGMSPVKIILNCFEVFNSTFILNF